MVVCNMNAFTIPLVKSRDPGNTRVVSMNLRSSCKSYLHLLGSTFSCRPRSEKTLPLATWGGRRLCHPETPAHDSHSSVKHPASMR